VRAERGAARLAGVPWGADFRLFRAHGIPAVMVGPRGIDRAHGVDERVAVDDLEALTRILVSVVEGFRPMSPARAARPSLSPPLRREEPG
jgi:acetylornithine deacetylase